MADWRHFTFMESWLDDMKDWCQEDKNEALWRIINYGIYREVDWDSIPVKEQAWYRNAFRVIDNGAVISKTNSVRGAAGGEQNKKHDSSRVPEALLAGCITAREVAEYIEGEGANPAWVFKVQGWKDRVMIWTEAGIPVDSKGNPDFSNRIPVENVGIQSESNGIPMEKKSEKIGKFVDSNGNSYDF